MSKNIVYTCMLTLLTLKYGDFVREYSFESAKYKIIFFNFY